MPPTAVLQGRLVVLDMHVRQLWLLDTASATAFTNGGGSFSWGMRAPDGEGAGYVLPGPLMTDGGDPVPPTARVSLVRGLDALASSLPVMLCARCAALLCAVPRIVLHTRRNCRHNCRKFPLLLNVDSIIPCPMSAA